MSQNLADALRQANNVTEELLLGIDRAAAGAEQSALTIAKLQESIDSLSPAPTAFVIVVPDSTMGDIVRSYMREFCGTFGIAPELLTSPFIRQRVPVILPSRAGRTRKGWRRAHALAMNRRRRKQRLIDCNCWIVPTTLSTPARFEYKSWTPGVEGR